MLLRLIVATVVDGVIDVGDDARSDAVDIALLIASTFIGDDAAEVPSLVRILSTSFRGATLLMFVQ